MEEVIQKGRGLSSPFFFSIKKSVPYTMKIFGRQELCRLLRFDLEVLRMLTAEATNPLLLEDSYLGTCQGNNIFHALLL
jgi:hypothetical protein